MPVVSFRHVQSKIRIAGFHCHHLIPKQVIEAQQFGIFFGTMKSVGFAPNDFCTNGMHLPCDEKTAYMIGRPIHRGGHPVYNKLVAEQISTLEKLPVIEALAGLGALQSHLRSALGFSDFCNLNLVRNPMRSALERDLETVGLLGAARMRMPRLP